MAKTTSALATPLREQLDRLAAFQPSESPVVSLYLDLRADETGRERYEPFLRKVLPERSRMLTGDARKSFQRDVQRIQEYLSSQVPRSANGVAIFASAANDEFFEAIVLEPPVEAHWLFIGSVPHLYPLARLTNQYPRYAALVLDTNSARLFVFSLGATEMQQQIRNDKTRRNAVGGWSQSRYQRHVDEIHLHHMKEVVSVLDRVVTAEGITQVVVSCDEVTRPLLMEQMPKHLQSCIVDFVNMDTRAPEHEVIARTFEVLREHDAGTDAARVESMMNAWRAGGLGVAGVDDTLLALEMGQVEELLIVARPELLRRPSSSSINVSPGPVEVETSAANDAADNDLLKLADELVTKAHQTGARVRFVEDGALLAAVGGVGALLRFTI